MRGFYFDPSLFIVINQFCFPRECAPKFGVYVNGGTCPEPPEPPGTNRNPPEPTRNLEKSANDKIKKKTNNKK